MPEKLDPEELQKRSKQEFTGILVIIMLVAAAVIVIANYRIKPPIPVQLAPRNPAPSASAK